ncbi:MAG: DUF475 domain-containing protein [Candidatus Micrarchaeota archaeon]
MIDLLPIIFTLIGLILFEVILGIDNAIINAHVLKTMSERAKRWFLVWGILIAVFLVRGLLPWFIVFLSNPALGPIGAFSASFSGDQAVIDQLEAAKPVLLIVAGVFMILLFLNWLFLEPKHYGLIGEKLIFKNGVWFYTIASFFMAAITWFAINKDPLMAFGAAMGSTLFFLSHGFKKNAEEREKELLEGKVMSDWSKIFYLEVIDAAFSIDAVLGAFAFTFNIPLIIIGSGVGAIAVRQLTIGNIERVSKLKYLKNGAMYSVFVLGTIMILNSFSFHIPEWASGVATIGIIAYFYQKSVNENNLSAKIAA